MGFIKNYHDLALSEERVIVLDLIEAAFASIQPQNVLNENFKLKNETLLIKDKKINLKDFERVFLIAFGKGSAEISSVLEKTIGNFLTKGFVIDTNNEEKFEKMEFTQGSHPLPSQENLNFTSNVLQNLKDLTEKDLVFVVICGGGSVMFEAPNITLEKLTEVNQALLRSGATISEMNIIRKHLSKVKGGGLVKLLFPAKIVSLIFSDVPGNDLSTIASGTTVIDKTTIDDAWQIYNKYDLHKLEFGENDFIETPKDENIFSTVENILILSNLTALNAMKKKANEMSIKAEIFSDKFESDAELAGKALIEKTKDHSILLAGGETTVKVINEKGVGGRNQTVVLGALFELDGKTVIASFDSDGWDNSPAAGAIGDIKTLEKAKIEGLSPEEYLRDNNSLVFFKNLRDAIVTDRLPSNVSDLIIVYKK
jgi:glycerate-2-kinase